MNIEAFLNFPFIIVPFVFTIIIFIIFREVLTWYWKLNKISDLLEKIEENTRSKNLNKTEKE